MNLSGLSALIAAFITDRKTKKLEALEKKYQSAIKNAALEAAHTLEIEWRDQRQQVEDQFAPEHWLTDAAKRARQISLATHLAKFSHSSAGASPVLDRSPADTSKPWLTTACLDQADVDVTGNAASLDVAKCLQLSHNDQSLADCIERKDPSPLAPFARDDAQLSAWLEGFGHALSPGTVQSHTLAKQIYFPVAGTAGTSNTTGSNESNSQNKEHNRDNGENESTSGYEYHLLCPLLSSALAQQVWQEVSRSRFDAEAKAVRKARRDRQYHEQKDVVYPGTALQFFGGSKPQNVSQLNATRNGRLYLLNTAPPVWKTRKKPPIAWQSLFQHDISYGTKRIIADLQAFLKRKRYQNDVETRRTRAKYVDEVINALLVLVAEIQDMRDEAGWSRQADRLDPYQALWLDPRRDDDDFKNARASNDWQEQVAGQFAVWLSRMLEKNSDYKLGEDETREWRRTCLRAINTFERGRSGRSGRKKGAWL